MNTYPSSSDRRVVYSKVLYDRMIANGHPERCDVPGCDCTTRSLLQPHHIVPIRIRVWNWPSNLGLLCVDHHSLVERYYWWALSQLNPEATAELRNIARRFKSRKVPLHQIERLRQRTRELWDALNLATNDPRWWRRTYRDALVWASKQHVVRHVAPSDAIVEIIPWWVEKIALEERTDHAGGLSAEIKAYALAAEDLQDGRNHPLGLRPV